METNRKLKIDKPLFITSVVTTLIISSLFVIYPNGSKNILSKLQSFTVNSLGSLFLWSIFITFLILLGISFSKIGRIKLGGRDEKPKFKFAAWFAMIFTSGTGSSIMYWATIEWAYYYRGGSGSLPWNMEPGTWQAAEWAAAYGLFHEGILAWTGYTLFAVVVAYFYYIRKKSVLRISEICEPVLGRYVHGYLGKIIDFSFIFAVIAGIATSFGFGSPMIAASIAKVFKIKYTFSLDVLVMVLWLIASLLILYCKLEKGIAVASDLNLKLFYVVLGIIFVFGPTRFIFDTFTTSVGLMTNNFIKMSLWTDSIASKGFPQSWTVFYLAWWLTFGPVMGIFIAKISQGRSIRSMIWAATFGGSLGCWAIYAVFGNFALWLDINGIYPAAQKILEGKNTAVVITEIISKAPFAFIVVPLFAILAFIYTLTSLVSASYTLAAVTTKNIEPNEEPERWNKMFWILLTVCISVALLSLGGLNNLKTASLVAAIPLLAIMIISIISFFICLKKDGLLNSEAIVSEDIKVDEK